MRRASPILGFTEAELGFVLAVLFAALAGSQVVEAKQSIARADSLQVALEATQDSLAEARRQLASIGRSSLTPYCSERGETSEVVASVTVLGSNSFSLASEPMDLDGVLARLRPWLDIASRKDCRFEVDVRPGDGLSAAEFLDARAPLGRLFYFSR